MEDNLAELLKSLPKDFWDFKSSDTRELTHGIHTYPAMMIYPISRNILSLVKQVYEPSVLLDPFCGSGTVLVEGTLAGVPTVYGNDINPLANLLATTKTTPLDAKEMDAAISALIQNINSREVELSEVISKANDHMVSELGLDLADKDHWGSNAPAYLSQYLETSGVEMSIPDFKNIGYWFTPAVIIELQLIKDCIKQVENQDIRRFMWVAFSETIRLVSNRRNGEFKMFRMKPEKVRTFAPSVQKEFTSILIRNAEKMNDYTKALTAKSSVNVFHENSADMKSVPDGSVDILITSPPYGDSRTTVAYGEFSRLSLQWIDMYDLSDKEIMGIDRSLMGGKKHKNGFDNTINSDTLRASLDKIVASDVERAGDVYSFYVDLDNIIAECARKSRSGSYQFWVVGNRTVKKENLKTDVIITELGKQYGLSHVLTMERMISNKVMPSRNSPTNVAGDTVTTMCNEHIVVLRKD